MTVFDLRNIRVRSGEEHREAVEVAIAPIELGGERYVAVPETVPAELSVTRASTGIVLAQPSVRLHRAVRALPHGRRRRREPAAERVPGNEPRYGRRRRRPDRRPADLSAWARDALILALPDKIPAVPLRGLCPECGRDLN
jgi:hypothetical protein